jgi:hypothetical protein
VHFSFVSALIVFYGQSSKYPPEKYAFFRNVTLIDTTGEP